MQVDPCLLSEQITSHLSVLAALMQQGDAEQGASAGRPCPPWAILRQLHPLLFAVPPQPRRHAAQVLVPTPEQEQQQAGQMQMAVFVQVGLRDWSSGCDAGHDGYRHCAGDMSLALANVIISLLYVALPGGHPSCRIILRYPRVPHQTLTHSCVPRLPHGSYV